MTLITTSSLLAPLSTSVFLLSIPAPLLRSLVSWIALAGCMFTYGVYLHTPHSSMHTWRLRTGNGLLMYVTEPGQTAEPRAAESFSMETLWQQSVSTALISRDQTYTLEVMLWKQTKNPSLSRCYVTVVVIINNAESLCVFPLGPLAASRKWIRFIWEILHVEPMSAAFSFSFYV